MDISYGGKIITGYYCLKCISKNPEIKRVLDTFVVRRKPPEKKKKCHFCGSTLKDLKESGFASCAMCYEIFRPYIRKETRKIHCGFFHRGKSPYKDNDARFFLEHLEDRMRTVVAQKDFEAIEKIREELELFLKNG